MSSVLAILPHDLCLGFSLAGIQTRPVSNHDEAVEQLRLANEEKTHDLVIVDETLIDELEPHIRKEYLRQTRPLIVPIPGELQWSDSEEPSRDDLVQRLIRQAVGYQLNIHF